MNDSRKTSTTSGWIDWLGAFVERPVLCPLSAALLAMLLASPSIFAGWVADDYYHRVKLVDHSRFHEVIAPSLDIFNFFDGDPARTHKMMDLGITPWWTYPELHGAFWRPLSALTHWLDYRLWPESPKLMHLHSLLWLGFLAALTACFFRRFCPDPGWAALATLLYVIDDAHGTPVGFLANRNALLATVFGLLALVFHDRWRRQRQGGFAPLAALAFACALLSAEAGTATFGYLVAYALVLDRETPRRRAASLLPYVLIAIAWRLTWSALGCGLGGVAIYVDPLSHPLRFIVAAAQRAPLYFLGQWALPPADIALVVPDAYAWPIAIAALMLLAVIAKLVYPVFRSDRTARFWALGMIFSVVPICAVFPSNRVLFFVGLGSMALIARFLQIVLSRSKAVGSIVRTPLPPRERGRGEGSPDEPHSACTPSARTRPRVALAIVFIAIHLILAPIGLVVLARAPTGSPAFVRRTMAADALDPSVEGRDLIVVNSPLAFFTHLIPASCEAHHRPMPRRLRVLAPAIPSVTIHRRDERTLVIRPADGFLSRIFDRLFRDGGAPMHLHERVELTRLTIEITALTPDARPAEATFRFDIPLEDPGLVWLHWKDDRFQPFTPPPVGTTIELRAGMPSLW